MKSQMNKKVVAMSNTPLMQPSEEVERLAHQVVGAALWFFPNNKTHSVHRVIAVHV